jgi:hypothetical protein
VLEAITDREAAIPLPASSRSVGEGPILPSSDRRSGDAEDGVLNATDAKDAAPGHEQGLCQPQIPLVAGIEVQNHAHVLVIPRGLAILARRRDERVGLLDQPGVRDTC